MDFKSDLRCFLIKVYEKWERNWTLIQSERNISLAKLIIPEYSSFSSSGNRKDFEK